MNVILTYKITESESGRSIAAFLLDSGYSSRLVVHLRNTAESFFLNGKTVFSNTVLQPEDCLCRDDAGGGLRLFYAKQFG